MDLLKNWKVKSPKTVELLLLLLMIAGLCSQIPVLAQPVQKNNIIKNSTTPSTSAFISTWDTALTSPSYSDVKIGLPLVSNGAYNFNVSWGDGSSNIITSYNQAQVNHTYASVNNYTVIITGLISGWEFRNGGDVQKIIGISQWGPLNLGNNGYYFWGASNLIINATDALNLAGTTNLELAFESCTNLGSTGNFNSWNTTAVTNMQDMFDGDSNFNQPLNNWNVSHVTSMSGLFAGASNFNQPIGNWNVSQVTDMSFMFEGAGTFNQPIGNWSVSHVTDMSYMFSSASVFNQPINNWNVSQVTDMTWMFSLASAFNQPIGNWNVSQVTDMSYMFWWDPSFNQPIGNWSVSSVTTMSSMFSLDSAFNQNISSWDVSHVTDMSNMFDQDSAFNQPIGNWSVGAVTNMYSMFDITSFNQSISNWDVSNVTDMSYMFYSNYAFNQNISTWNVGNVTTMSWMFSLSRFNQPIDNWDVSKVTDMSMMFYGDSVFNQSIGQWDVSSVINMYNMFYDDYAFNQPLGAWNVSNVAWTASNTGMIGMFTGDTLSVQNYDNLLIGWSKLTLQPNVEFDGGNSQYSYKAASARQSIITNFNWYFNDGGEYNLTAPQSVHAYSGYKSILLTWSAPSSDGGSAVTNYSIYRSTSSSSGFALINTVSASTYSYNDTNLVAQTTYYYIITANNGFGNSTNSTVISAITNSVPSAPQSLQAQPGFASVVLSWQAPITTGGYPITGYNIYVSTTGGSTYNFYISVGSSTFSYNITGLSNGVQYYFEVTANNSVGTSLYPPAVYATPYTVPAVTQYVTATSGNTFVVLSWQAPIFTGGSTITGYSIYGSTNGGTSYYLVTSVSGTTYSYNDTGLTNGQTYYFEVSASNIAGSGPNSTVVSATPSIVNVPTAPQSLTAQSGNTYAVLSWSAPSSNGGSPITGYGIYISTNGGASFTLVYSVSASTLFYNITGLIGGTTYYFEVTASNSAGSSPYSNVVYANVYSVPTVPQSFTAQAGHSSVLLSWSVPSSNGGLTLTGYNIYISTNGGTSFSLLTPVTSSTLSYNDSYLTNGQTYYFKISAINSAGSSANSTVVSATPYSGSTVPTTPQSLTAQPGNGYVFLSWLAPSSNGGSTITGYNIYISINGGTSFTLLTTISASTLSYKDIGLTNGQTYYFEVTASNSAGEGAYSTIVSATPNSVSTVPTAPQSLTVQAGHSSALLTWTTPSSNGGSAITGYNIYISTNSGTSFTLLTTISASTLSYNDTGLTNGQTYYFEVTASNSVGSSAYSSMVSATPNSGFTVPSVPPSIMAQTGNAYIYLSWNASKSDGGSAITGYNIYESTNSGSSYKLLTSVGATTLSYNVTGLTNGQTYYFEITAKNSVGMSSYSPYVFGTPFAPFSHSSTSSTSSNSNTQSTGGTKTTSGTITTTDGFIFIFPILSLIFIYFKRQKRN